MIATPVWSQAIIAFGAAFIVLSEILEQHCRFLFKKKLTGILAVAGQMKVALD